MTEKKDRFEQMNAVLDAAVAEVSKSAVAYRKNQERIGKDKTPATASPLSEGQAAALAREAVNARRGPVFEAAIASVAAEIRLG